MIRSDRNQSDLSIPLFQEGLNGALKSTLLHSLKKDLIQPDQLGLGTSGLILIHATQIAVVIPVLARFSRVDVRRQCTAEKYGRKDEQNEIFHFKSDGKIAGNISMLRYK